MHLRMATLALVCLFPTCVFAFESTVKSRVFGLNSTPVAGATVTAGADPFWGKGDEQSLSRHEEQHGPVPRVEVTGSAETGAQGDFELKIVVTAKGDVPLPRRVTRGGPQGGVLYAQILLRVSAPLYLQADIPVAVDEGGMHENVRIGLERIHRLRGRAIDAAGNPVPGLPIVLDDRSSEQRPDRTAKAVGSRTETKTGEDGRFELECRRPVGAGCLRVNDGKSAFAQDSKAWQQLYVWDVTDLGDLPLEPGGSIRGEAVNSDTREPVFAHWVARRTGLPELYAQVADESGKAEFHGLIPGTYSVIATFAGRGWGVRLSEVEVKPGQITNVGTRLLQPARRLNLEVWDPAGKPVQNLSATAALDDGELPYPAQRSNNRLPFAVSQNHNASRTDFDDLFSGTWTVRIDAAPHAVSFARVSIPAQDTLRVTLTQGGTISASLTLPRQDEWSGECRAIMHCTPSLPTYLNASADFRWNFDENYLPPEGVFIAQRKHTEAGIVAELPRLPAGAYLVAFWAHRGQVLRDNVTVTAGQTTRVEVIPEPSRIEVAVTHKGSPAAGQRLTVVRTDELRRESLTAGRLREALTDATGLCTFEIQERDSYFVLTEPEAQFARSRAPYGALRDIGRRLEIGYSQTRRLRIELHDPARIWVTVKLRFEGAATPGQSALRGLSQDFSGHVSGFAEVGNLGVARFLPLPAGSYEFSADIRMAGRDSLPVRRRVEISRTPEHLLELAFEFHDLTVKVKSPGAGPHTDVLLYDAEFNEPPDFDGGSSVSRYERFLRGERADEKGTAVLPLVTDGEYLLVARVHDETSLLHVVHERITVKGPATKSLFFPDATGRILLEVHGDPAMGQAGIPALGCVSLTDAGGRPVPIPDPDARWFRVGTPRLLISVPAGTYTLTIVAQGMLPESKSDVVVRVAETARVQLTLSPAGLLSVELAGAPHQAAISQYSVRVVFEDQEGKRLAPPAPGLGNAILPERLLRGPRHLFVHSLTRDVARVRIRIEGFREFVVPVDVEYGRACTAEVELVLEDS